MNKIQLKKKTLYKPVTVLTKYKETAKGPKQRENNTTMGGIRAPRRTVTLGLLLFQ